MWSEGRDRLIKRFLGVWEPPPSPPPNKIKPVRDFINVGTDDHPFLLSSDATRCVLDNNSLSKKIDTSNIKRMRTAMDIPFMRMFNMDRRMASDPRLEKICADEQNNFFFSRFESYRFNNGEARSDDELHEKANDFKYLMNLCGSHLKVLNVEAYPFSQVMPLINTNCPNLNELILQFKKIEDRDFENVFSNMLHLEIVRINWQCENSSLPLTLVKSLEKVGRTLKELCLSRDQNKGHLCLPDSLASVFPQLLNLQKLNLINFELCQSLIQSISEMKNLAHLKFICSWMNNDPVFDKKINMYPIGNLENLETLYINFDCGVTDEFLINLSNNAMKLTRFDIIGKNITDNGMTALNNLRELESLKFNLNEFEENVFITDESIQCFVHEKLEYLNLSNCIRTTNKSVLQLFKNLPNLNILYVRNSSITFEIAKEISEVTQNHKKPLYVYVSFEDRDALFNSLALSGIVFKSNFNTRKYIDILV